ncbi:Cytochrome c oxidase subunit 6b-1, partial [Dichanthelium oligosanthes]
LKTAPADFRFPTTNQTRHCFTRYVEYHRCVNAKEDGTADCEKFAKYYRSLCPGEWVSACAVFCRTTAKKKNLNYKGMLSDSAVHERARR